MNEQKMNHANNPNNARPYIKLDVIGKQVSQCLSSSETQSTPRKREVSRDVDEASRVARAGSPPATSPVFPHIDKRPEATPRGPYEFSHMGLAEQLKFQPSSRNGNGERYITYLRLVIEAQHTCRINKPLRSFHGKQFI